MHELALCQGVMQQVQDIAAQHHAQRVTGITLCIGPLAGVEPQLLRQAFPLASAGSIAAEAELIIEDMAIRIRCHHCGAENEAEINRLLCPDCGDYRTQVISGDEMLLASVELLH